MIIELDFPLPTWNRILAMGHWERKKLRESIHRMTYMCTQYEKDSQTLTVSPLKQQLMDSLKLEYLQMIRPSSSKKSVLAKKKVSRRKR